MEKSNKLISIDSGDTFIEYCFTRHAKRTFLIQNVLAVAPIKQYEHKVI